jgi:hypothetical protein
MNFVDILPIGFLQIVVPENVAHKVEKQLGHNMPLITIVDGDFAAIQPLGLSMGSILRGKLNLVNVHLGGVDMQLLKKITLAMRNSSS